MKPLSRLLGLCLVVASSAMPAMAAAKADNAQWTSFVNAYIDGYGSLATLEKEIDTFGLSPEGSKKLLEIFKQRQKNTSEK